jgi:hypothetical protein
VAGHGGLEPFEGLSQRAIVTGVFLGYSLGASCARVIRPQDP